MAEQPTRRLGWDGSAIEPIGWPTLVEIFDYLYGSESRGLPHYPASLDRVSIHWKNAEATEYQPPHLNELREAYEAGQTVVITFNGRVGHRYADFVYWPGAPRPRAQVRARSLPDEVEAMIAPVRAAFPQPFGGAIVFLSWGGDASRDVAAALQSVLQPRLPIAKIFFSPMSIDPGDDPMRRTLEEGLLEAQVLIAALTADAAQRPWVIWETATAWAKEQLVIPVFVDIEPRDVSGPLTAKVQGVHLANREEMNRAIATVAAHLGMDAPSPLTDQEHEDLARHIR